jgi:hypothetical protein
VVIEESHHSLGEIAAGFNRRYGSTQRHDAALIRGASCDEQPFGDVLGEHRVHRLLAPKLLRTGSIWRGELDAPAGKSASTTRGTRRASSASAVDLPVPDVPDQDSGQPEQANPTVAD